jgi:hypothetical protein
MVVLFPWDTPWAAAVLELLLHCCTFSSKTKRSTAVPASATAEVEHLP